MKSSVQKIDNPFSGEIKNVLTNAAANTDGERAIAEVQAAIVLAKRFPRDTVAALDQIINTCTRPTLAEAAIYAYPRGGENVTGPSIRLAEAVAQCWGNIQYGIRELSQENGVSTVEAFAWDMQNNVRATKVFQVSHQRKARGKIKQLTDPRDIYEMVANQGARRMRACILAIIPGDVIEAAVKQCELTQANNVQVDKDSVEKLVAAFEEFGVTQEMLSHRLGGKHLNKMIAAEMLNLRRIYRSLKDGMAKPSDFFDMSEESQQAEQAEALLNEGKKNE